MHACKFSDLFRSQLCTWLVQLNVLCSFTLIFLLHVLHSVKFSLSIHHISHQLLCWVIITRKRFPLVSAQFVLFFHSHSVCMSIHLVAVPFWSFPCRCCFHLVARREKHLERWVPKGSLQENSSQGTRQDTGRKKCCFDDLYKDHCFDEVWEERLRGTITRASFKLE